MPHCSPPAHAPAGRGGGASATRSGRTARHHPCSCLTPLQLRIVDLVLAARLLLAGHTVRHIGGQADLQGGWREWGLFGEATTPPRSCQVGVTIHPLTEGTQAGQPLTSISSSEGRSSSSLKPTAGGGSSAGEPTPPALAAGLALPLPRSSRVRDWSCRVAGSAQR